MFMQTIDLPRRFSGVQGNLWILCAQDELLCCHFTYQNRRNNFLHVRTLLEIFYVSCSRGWLIFDTLCIYIYICTYLCIIMDFSYFCQRIVIYVILILLNRISIDRIELYPYS